MAVVLAAEALPTAEQVVAGYRQNAALFPAPRVTIHRTLRDTPELARYWQQQAAAMERVLADPARSPGQRQQAEAVLAEAREMQSEREAIYEHLDFWTDGHGWQARIPFRDPSGRHRPNHAFPNQPLTTETLSSLFARHRIYSLAAGPESICRAWYGAPNPAGPPLGRISNQLLDELPSEVELPPLVRIARPNRLPVHAIDAALAQDTTATLRVLGYELVDGRRLLKVEHARLAPGGEPHQAPGELLAGDVITAWVDPAQGYLPLVAVWRKHWQLDGRPLNAAHRLLHETLHTTRIAKIPGGGFYPIAGSIRLHTPDPLGPAPPSIDELAAGKGYNPALIPSHEIGWTVEKIEPTGGSDARVYQMAFPPQTEIFDEQAAKRPHVPLKTGETAPPLRVGAWTDQRARVLADYRGRVVVLCFWMSGEPACEGPLAALEELSQSLAPQGVSVLGIHVGNTGPDALRHTALARGLSFPCGLDTGTDQNPASTLSAYHVRWYPTIVVVDGTGRIAFSSDDPSMAERTRNAATRLGIAWPLSAGIDASEAWKRLYIEILGEGLRPLLAARPSGNR